MRISLKVKRLCKGRDEVFAQELVLIESESPPLWSAFISTVRKSCRWEAVLFCSSSFGRPASQIDWHDSSFKWINSLVFYKMSFFFFTALSPLHCNLIHLHNSALSSILFPYNRKNCYLYRGFVYLTWIDFPIYSGSSWNGSNFLHSSRVLCLSLWLKQHC